MADQKRAGPFEQIGEAVGGALGKAAGRANDMAMNAVSSLFGTALSQMNAWWSSPDADRAARAFGEEEDRACRQHFETSGTGGSSEYQRARPAYQFGHMARHNPEYQTKPFDHVEADLERAWEQAGRDRFGDWPRVREQVRFGYSHRPGGAGASH